MYIPRPKQNQEECNHGILQWKGTIIPGNRCTGIGLGASLLQDRDWMWFPSNIAPNYTALQLKVYASKSLTSAETYYSNIQRKVQTQPWNRDYISGMCITICTLELCTDIPDCMKAEEIRKTILEDEHLTDLEKLIMYSWPSTKSEVQKEIQHYWSIREEIAIIDGIAMKGRRIITPASLSEKARYHLHISYMGIEKTRVLAHDSTYWINMNADIKVVIKTALHVLINRPHNPRTRLCRMKY